MDTVVIRSACSRLRSSNQTSNERSNLVIPGDLITVEQSYLKGHGVYVDDEDKILASVAGVVQQLNRLITVSALKARYTGKIGDVVVGRIIEVGQKRWKVDINTSLDSVLKLSAINLPGGEQRRRCNEDERSMREYLSEGDLISAEVHAVFTDGVVAIHTRSLKYGKLGQGVLVKVSPSLIIRRKTHFHNLAFGASIILGNNGYIWIAPSVDDDSDQTGGYEQNLEPVPKADRDVIARLRNCILALSDRRMMLFDTSIVYAYEASLSYQARNILLPEVMQEIADTTRQRLEQEWSGHSAE